MEIEINGQNFYKIDKEYIEKFRQAAIKFGKEMFGEDFNIDWKKGEKEKCSHK